MHSGMVALVGRPNVGKSSLVNALIGEKISIVSRKPQTTRHQIQGVLHGADSQIVFVDTPGLHSKQPKALNRALNHAAATAIFDVDVAVFVIEAGRFGEEDQAVLERLRERKGLTGLVINKIDKLADKSRLLPQIQQLTADFNFDFVVPVSATRNNGLEQLRDELLQRMPEGPPLYPPEQIRGYELSFSVSEIIREKLFERLGQELPYALTVETEQLERDGEMLRIGAVIWVERDGQKVIVIGQQGKGLKAVGTAARKELEQLTGRKVFLKLWVRVKAGWSDNPGALRSFGIE